MQDPQFFHRLQKGRQPRGITARVIRKWTLYENSQGNTPLYVGMVLADAKGDAMYAEISDDLIEHKAYLFEVGKVYIIKKFVVEDNKKTYRAVNRNLRIDVTRYTTAEAVPNPPPSIPEYIYNLTPFHAIKVSKIIYSYTDVIGYLIKYDVAHTFVPKNTEKKKTLRDIYLKDLRENVMKITLWGDHAVNFSPGSMYDDKVGNLIVCLVVGCIPRQDFRNSDKVALTGSPACAYYFNPKIPEATSFHSRFKDTAIYIERAPESDNSALIPVNDIELQRKTIAALHDVDPFDEEDPGPFKCSVTVRNIGNPASWWYMSCKPCKKKAEQQADHSYKCPKCLGSDTVPRYNITFTGADATGEAQFFAFDDEAQKIIQRDCESVLISLGASDGLPQAIKNIINKTFIFSVDLTNDSCKKLNKRRHQVKAVLERPGRHTNTTNVSQPQQMLMITDGSAHDASTSAAQRQSEALHTPPATLSTPLLTIDLTSATSKHEEHRLRAVLNTDAASNIPTPTLSLFDSPSQGTISAQRNIMADLDASEEDAVDVLDGGGSEGDPLAQAPKKRQRHQKDQRSPRATTSK